MLILERKVGQKIILTNESTKETIQIQLYSLFEDTKSDQLCAAIAIKANHSWRIDRSEVLKSRRSQPLFKKNSDFCNLRIPSYKKHFFENFLNKRWILN